jgi:NUMOD4 motif
MSEFMEQWRPVVGYEEFYQVSDYGRVKGPRKILNPFPRGKGKYLAVTLYRDKKCRPVYVHVMVLEAFDKPRPADMQALHGLAGKLFNRYPDNLRWGTAGENWADKYRDGTATIGSQNPSVKLTEAIVLDCRTRHDAARGITCKTLAVEYGVSLSAIHRAVTGRTWRHVT